MDITNVSYNKVLGLATESSSNGKIMYDGILSESFSISMLMRKAFEVDKFETYLSKLPASKLLYRFEFLITSCTGYSLTF